MHTHLTHTHTHTHNTHTHTHTGWIGEDTEDDIDAAIDVAHTPHSPRGADEENGYFKPKPPYAKLPSQAPAVPPLITTPFDLSAHAVSRLPKLSQGRDE